MQEDVKRKILLKKSKYRRYYAHGDFDDDGVLLFHTIFSSIKPTTRLSLNNIKDRLKAVTLFKFGGDVKAMIDEMERLHQEFVRLSEGQEYEDYVLLLFRALSKTSNNEFNTVMQQQKTTWESGTDITAETLISIAEIKWNNIISENGGQPPEDPRDAKLISLATQLEDLKKQLKGGNNTSQWKGLPNQQYSSSKDPRIAE